MLFVTIKPPIIAGNKSEPCGSFAELLVRTGVLFGIAAAAFLLCYLLDPWIFPPGRQPVLGAVHAPQPVYAGSATAAARDGATKPAPAKKAKAPPVYLRLSGVFVNDGDTLTADVLLPYGITWSRRKIRVLGFDAYESSPARRTVELVPDEIALGRRATAAAIKCLAEADAVFIEATPDLETTYDRMLGRIWFDPPGEDETLVEFGAWMRQRGFARPTDPVLEKQAKEKKPNG